MANTSDAPLTNIELPASVVMDHATSFWSSLIMLSSACTLFVTSRWSSHMREWEPSLSEADVVSIVTVLDVGAFLAFIPGLFFDTFGCKLVGYVGAFLSLGGYVSMYLILQGGGGTSVALLCFVGFIIGQGSIWLVVCALNTVTGNFEKEDRGRAVGLVMTTFGLSAGIFSNLMLVVRGAKSDPNLLALIGIAMGLISLMSNFGIAKLPRGRLLTAKLAGTNQALALSILALILITLQALWHPDINGWDVLALTVAGLYALVLAFQAFLVLRLLLRRGCSIFYSHTFLDEANNSTSSSSPPASFVELDGASFLDALKTSAYWQLLFVFFVAVGIGQTMSNSIADMPGLDAAAGVAIFAAGNSLGRFVPGYLSDILFRVIDRMAFIVIATVLLCVAQFIMLVGQQNRFAAYLGIFLTALSFGSYWVLVPAVEAEWFGRLHFGKIHGFLLFLAGDGGVVLLYKGTASLADESRGPCDEKQRVAGCFQLKWLLCFVLAVAGLVAAVTMRFYRQRMEARIPRSPLASSMHTALRVVTDGSSVGGRTAANVSYVGRAPLDHTLAQGMRE